MHRPLALLLMPMFLGAADLTVDHVTVAGKDLKVMMSNLAPVGLKCEYVGAHSNRATEMALTSFPDGSYLDLIAVQPTADPAAFASHVSAKQMQNNAGPCAWAVRTSDIGTQVDEMKDRAIVVSVPIRNGRTRPDGTQLRWETAQVGDEPNGTFSPFLIRHLTPRRERASPSGRPTTKDFSGITKIVIAVRNWQASVDRYRKAYQLPPPMKQVDADFGAHLASFGGTPVILAEPLTPQSWLATCLDQLGEGPSAFILGARKAGRYTAVSKARWFGIDISWLDDKKLGWHLGFE